MSHIEKELAGLVSIRINKSDSPPEMEIYNILDKFFDSVYVSKMARFSNKVKNSGISSIVNQSILWNVDQIYGPSVAEINSTIKLRNGSILSSTPQDFRIDKIFNINFFLSISEINILVNEKTKKSIKDNIKIKSRMVNDKINKQINDYFHSDECLRLSIHYYECFSRDMVFKLMSLMGNDITPQERESIILSSIRDRNK
jgi:hypothetical protein